MPVFEYLCVDDFLTGLVEARALHSAFELRLIDHLQAHQPCTLDALAQALGGDRSGLHLLLDLLRANHVVEGDAGAIRLSQRFLTALQYRDVLEAKLDLANFVAPDFINLFTALLDNPGHFMRQARLFELFDYQRCFEPSPENYALTKRWMRITTALTKYEARVCLHYHDFVGEDRDVLDNNQPKLFIDPAFWPEFMRNGFYQCVYRAACGSRQCLGLNTAYVQKYGWHADVLVPFPMSPPSG